MKLKTLKDISGLMRVRDEDSGIIVDFTKGEWVDGKTLRQEAIKRIKSKNTGGFSFVISCDGKVSKYDNKKKSLNSLDYANLGAMIELIEFFNITEEDLWKIKEY